ncbi:phosphatidylserine decarboxylase [Sulfurospirillum arsenophilum]|uniref:phosphatidylserine decarboxylase n=1 Tax=Sulfurospirillum arsenophilum TaxID=56698 RepID=UPI001E3E88E1|nr:phosphatidylserine decarboxylase [Sulfurospirillum arsenophilum]
MSQKFLKNSLTVMRNTYDTSTQIIAKEGWNQIVFTFMVFLLSYALSFFSWIFFLIFIATLYSYRNPERIQEEDDEHCIVAPMDGIITDVSKIGLRDGSEALRVVIRKSFFDVGVLRSPLSMEIVDVKKRFGLFMASSSPLFSRLSDRKTFTCKSKFASIKMVISAGLWSQKITLFSKIGSFKAGERLGFLRDGEVALLLPLDTRVKVSLNDEVKAGMSVLGYLAYKDKDVK